MSTLFMDAPIQYFSVTFSLFGFRHETLIFAERLARKH